ncbi:hypothetical protein PVAG01_03236 [Phlyctema vagabunda]|uniref:DUF6594 domain-containing protein n=1 Tax=Phlyctema vagabunda TaxID=108571 RepID=A0ABR4PST9_9HELO
MANKFITPSIEAILEACEDNSHTKTRDREAEVRYQPFSHDQMSPLKANMGKEREKSKKHKSSSSGTGKHTKSKSKSSSTRRATIASARDHGSRTTNLRHRRTMSNHSTSSSSSSSEAEDVLDHRTARGRLTSPSVISNLTALTTSTNKSSGSSGSNSTVTQASITKRSSLVKSEAIPETPLSPACPDPPDVFAYLEKDDDEEEHGQPTESPWYHNNIENPYPGSSLPPHLQTGNASTSSSSSYHGDDISEPAADNDTDRSTSPERSFEDHDEPEMSPGSTGRASAKVASQLAAAQQRQDLHANAHSFGTPDMQRGTAILPHLPASALSPRYNHVRHRSLPRGEKLPVTGYELLASRLTTQYNREGDDSPPAIKPVYRKFEALNHRLLLHLQDELGELEEQLHRLDNADTQSRRTKGQIIPASRRAAAQSGGELEWHKVDILGKIGYKLAQYNQALSSFNSTQNLGAPAPEDISSYRDYLARERVIAESETRFLDPVNDLVSLSCGSRKRSKDNGVGSSPSTTSQPAQPPSSVYTPQLYAQPSTLQPTLPGLAAAVAISVLAPILTFSVIPGFVGRMTVVLLVASGLVGAALFMAGTGVVGRYMLSRDWLVCSAIYAGVMVVVAGIMS